VIQFLLEFFRLLFFGMHTGLSNQSNRSVNLGDENGMKVAVVSDGGVGEFLLHLDALRIYLKRKVVHLTVHAAQSKVELGRKILDRLSWIEVDPRGPPVAVAALGARHLGAGCVRSGHAAGMGRSSGGTRG
jgi:hypothetical protein